MDYIKFIISTIIVFLSVCCNTHFQTIEYKILDNKYVVEINTFGYNFSVDKSRVYIGNEELIYLYNKDLGIGLELIIGNSNPSPNYFYVFDFHKLSLEDQFRNFKDKKFIKKTKFIGGHGDINSIYYIEDDELEKIESQFIALDSLIVNTRMVRNLKFIDRNKLIKVNKKILSNILIKRISN